VSQEWYYSVDGDRQGPVGAAELKKLADAGTLKPTDLVWKDGMADWAPARSIKGLFGAGAGAAPAGAAPSPSRSGEQAAAQPRTDEADADDRPTRRRPRDDEDDEDDRPSRRRRDEDEDDDRPAGRLRRRDEDDEDEDRPVRRRRDEDDEDLDEDRPRKKKRRIPEDVGSKKMVAGILAILLNSLGIHKFYLGMTGAGLTMLLVTVLTCGIGGMVMGVIGIIEGIIYLTKSDEDFYQTYVVEQKAWF
jgi:TM2 domain-containing membrane protein YozV